MVGGLICSDDVIYFLAVILLFLWLSVIKLNNEKTRRSLLSKTMRYALAVCTIIVIGFVIGPDNCSITFWLSSESVRCLLRVAS